MMFGVSKETAASPDWCEIHGGWFDMCPMRIEINSDFRDVFGKCVTAHDKKVIQAIEKELN